MVTNDNIPSHIDEKTRKMVNQEHGKKVCFEILLSSIHDLHSSIYALRCWRTFMAAPRKRVSRT